MLTAVAAAATTNTGSSGWHARAPPLCTCHGRRRSSSSSSRVRSTPPDHLWPPSHATVTQTGDRHRSHARRHSALARCNRQQQTAGTSNSAPPPGICASACCAAGGRWYGRRQKVLPAGSMLSCLVLLVVEAGCGRMTVSGCVRRRSLLRIPVRYTRVAVVRTCAWICTALLPSYAASRRRCLMGVRCADGGLIRTGAAAGERRMA